MKPLSENRIPSPDNYRKVSKPLIEKKRRARINASLNELKSLLESVLGAEIPRDSKMEKADILELAVKHLKRINRSRMNGGLMGEYRNGYGECATETSRFLGNVHGVDSNLRTRLINHLANTINNTTQTTHFMTSQNQTSSTRRHNVDYSRLSTPLHVDVSGQYSNLGSSPIRTSTPDYNGNYLSHRPISSVNSSGLLMTSPMIMTSYFKREVRPEISVWRPW